MNTYDKCAHCNVDAVDQSISGADERQLHGDYTRGAQVTHIGSCIGNAQQSRQHRIDSHIAVRQNSAKATFASSMEDYYSGSIDLNTHLIAHPAATFLVRVSGWSMQGAGISSGDELIVDKSLRANDGNIIVAVVDGELIVRRLRMSAQGVALYAENPQYPNIIIGTAQWFLWGVVTYVLHHC